VRGQYLRVKSLTRDKYFSAVFAVLGLGKGESPKSNIASPAKESSRINLLMLLLIPTVLSMVKAKLPETYCSSSSCIGNGLGRDGAFEEFNLLNDVRLK